MTCKKAKAWLSQQNVDYHYRDILKEPPGPEELAGLASHGGLTTLDLLNPKSKALKDSGADVRKLTPAEAGELISGNPRIMYRPILTNGKALVLGFKPAEMEKLL